MAPKKKMELAKNKKQLVLAVLLLVLFFGRLIQLGVSAVMQKQEEARLAIAYEQQLKEQANNPDQMMNEGVLPSSEQPQVQPQEQPQGQPQEQSQPQTASEQASQEPQPYGIPPEDVSSGPSISDEQYAEMNKPNIPLILGFILIFILLASVVVIVFMKLMQENSKTKKIAKDNKQLVLAGLLILLCVGKLLQIGFVAMNEKIREARIEKLYNEMVANPSQSSLQPLSQEQTQLQPMQQNQGNSPIASSGYSPSSNQDVNIEIIAHKNSNLLNGKRVEVPVSFNYSSNPFVPYDEAILKSTLPKFTLLEPPTVLPENSEAKRVSETTVSGILYDKYSPSAILSINGVDHLVKRGDVIDNYKVLLIDKDKVVVQLGSNIFKAGVGQLLTEGQINYNNVPNLSHRFGGTNDVQIRIRR